MNTVMWHDIFSPFVSFQAVYFFTNLSGRDFIFMKAEFSLNLSIINNVKTFYYYCALLR